MAFEAITVSSGSYLTTFVKGSPTRNGLNYVKTGGVLMLPKWGCGGQRVPEDHIGSYLTTFVKGPPPHVR